MILGLHPKFLLAGDSKIKITVAPFTNVEELGDPHKRLFNLRLSGLNAQGSENIFGM